MAVVSVRHSMFRRPAFVGRWIEGFFASRSGPFRDGVLLTNSRVYILPTRIGVIYALLLLFLLLGAINYSKSLGFVLTFLLASLGMIAMLATWRNLAGLYVRDGGSTPVYCGETARFAVQLQNNTHQPRYSLSLVYRGREHDVVDVMANHVALAGYRCPAKSRGELAPGRLRIETEYPLGLFVAWTWIDLDQSCLVYPTPATQALSPPARFQEQGEEQAPGKGLEDYAGLRRFQSGDSWRRVSWKAAARSDALYTKEFSGGQPESQWIDWDTIEAITTEQRLSLMCRMVLDAESAGRLYGLRLPDNIIAPEHGSRHQHQCLAALALYGLHDDVQAD